MKKFTLGSFKTNGKLICGDPGYEKDSASLVNLKVKSGEYLVEVIRGNLKEPLFRVDELDFFFRNISIKITHKDYIQDSLVLKKSTKHISVDSGQAGFFNEDSFGLDLQERELVNKAYGFFHNSKINAYFEIKDTKQMILDKSRNELYSRILKEVYKEDEEKYLSRLETEVKIKEESLIRYDEILKTRNYPSYYKIEKEKDFYKIICDQTSGEHEAGVLPIGCVSQTGLGDGGYDLYVAKNKEKEIVSAKIKFLNLKDIKESK